MYTCVDACCMTCMCTCLTAAGEVDDLDDGGRGLRESRDAEKQLVATAVIYSVHTKYVQLFLSSNQDAFLSVNDN